MTYLLLLAGFSYHQSAIKVAQTVNIIGIWETANEIDVFYLQIYSSHINKISEYIKHA